MTLTMKKVLIFLSILLPMSVNAQNCAEKIKAAKASKSAGNYRLALSQFSAAASDCGPEKSAEIQREILDIYDKIDDLKKQADNAKVAVLQNLAMAQEAIEIALAEKEKAEVAEKRAIAVLSKIYFYKEHFGLAYDQSGGKYGFIDKNLTTKIVFKYEEAQPFEYPGVAKVKYEGQYFLIDTLGNQYFLTTELDQLSPITTALDLRGKELIEMPNSVRRSPQLKIVLISGNRLTNVSGIENLTNLTILNLWNNRLTSVVGLGNLIGLTTLGLSSNRLTSVAGLEKLTNLTTLDFWNNQLTNVVGLSKLTNLTSLSLGRNQVTSTAGLEKLTRLTSLDLGGNQLTSTVGLENLTNLRRLILTGMKLPKKEIEALRDALPKCKIYVSEKLLTD